ncbi:MAG: GNAT family N-acetyltransferase [Anaerolineae bacterium]
MDTRYSIRRAVADDAAVIAHHRRAMFEDMGLRGDMDAMERSFTAWAPDQITSGHYLGWLVVDSMDRGVVAGAGVRLFEWPGLPATPEMHTRPYVLNVYVEPPHRRQGLARTLLETILLWAREEKYPMVTLHASEFGRPLYEIAWL